MTDADLAKFLAPDYPDLGLQLVSALGPEKRKTLERMAAAFNEIELWNAGLGPRPRGVILCGPRRRRRAARA